MSSWIWWETNSHLLKGYWYHIPFFMLTVSAGGKIQTWVCVRMTVCCKIWNYLWVSRDGLCSQIDPGFHSPLGQDCYKTCKSKYISDGWFEIQIQAQTFPRLKKLMFDIWVRSRIKGSCGFWVWSCILSGLMFRMQFSEPVLCQNIIIFMSTVETEGKL